jgi:hypothetical protein
MRLPLHSRTAIGAVFLGADWLLSKAEHVDFIAGHFSSAGQAMSMLRSVDFSVTAMWVLALVGVVLIVSDWWPKASTAGSSEFRGYMPLSNVIDHIAFLSNWSKTTHPYNAGRPSEEFRRVAELGEVEAIGVRVPGKIGFGWQKIPPSHWIIAVLPEGKTWMPGTPARLGTETLVPGAAAYEDVRVRQRDVYRAWPKDRLWHKVGRVMASKFRQAIASLR